MNHPALERVAELIAERNAVDAEIAAIAGRTALASHLGEWKRRRSVRHARECAVTRRSMTR